MRPGEVAQMRTCDVFADDPELPAAVRGLCWVYRPESHKTEHHGRRRLILLGPHAQAILQPWLRPAEPERYLFSPTEAREWWLANHRRGKGKRPRKTRPKLTAGDRYEKDSYRHAITKGCEKALGMPPGLRKIARELTAAQKRLPADQQEQALAHRKELLAEAREWRRMNCWHPHQLRHNAATRIRAAYGVEVARIILGHAHVATTEIYAEADLVKAARAMADAG